MINIKQKYANGSDTILDDMQIAQLEALANYLPMEQVAGYFDISVDDFLVLQKKDKRVSIAYKKGKVRGICKVAKLLWQQIEGGNLAAIIFFLKSRAGWSEKPIAEDRDKLPVLKRVKIKFKTPEVKKVQIDIPKSERLKLVDINRRSSGLVIPISLKVMEMREVA